MKLWNWSRHRCRLVRGDGRCSHRFLKVTKVQTNIRHKELTCPCSMSFDNPLPDRLEWVSKRHSLIVSQLNSFMLGCHKAILVWLGTLLTHLPHCTGTSLQIPWPSETSIAGIIMLHKNDSKTTCRRVMQELKRIRIYFCSKTAEEMHIKHMTVCSTSGVILNFKQGHLKHLSWSWAVDSFCMITEIQVSFLAASKISA